MKAKMIKKILAVMLAASTVMSMSGLVMAGPNDPKEDKPKKTLGQKRSRDDEKNESDDEENEIEEESEGGKKLKIGEGQYIKINQSKKEKEKSDEKDKQVKEETKANDGEPDEMHTQESNLISRFNDLFKENFKDDSEKMEFAGVVRDLSSGDFFNKCSKSKIKKLMKRLIQCLQLDSDNVNVKSDISQAITSIIVKCNLNKESINDLLNILDLCSQTDNNKAKLNVMNAISTVVDGGLCCGFNNQQINSLVAILARCSNAADEETAKCVAKATETMLQNGVVDESASQQIDDMAAILLKCSMFPGARQSVVASVALMAQKNLIGVDFICKFNNQQINNLIEILARCSNAADEETAKCVAKATKTVIQDDVVDESASQQIDDMTAILLKCSMFPGARESVVVSVALMAQKKLIGKFKNQQINDLTEILARCSETDNQGIKEYITRIVAFIARDTSFSVQQIQTLVNILKQCMMTSETGSVKKFAAMAIHNLIQKALVDKTFHRGGLGDKYEKELIKDLTSQLIVCSDSAEAQKYVIRAIGLMAVHSLLIGYGKEQLVELSNMLVGLSNNSHVKSDVAWTIERLAYGGLVRGGFFAGFDKEQRLKLTKALINCSKNSNAKANVASAIGRFVSGGLLRGYTIVELGELEAALISCVGEYAAKPNVALAISTLARVGWFRGHDKQQIVDIVNVLRSCLENDKAKKGVARAIGYLTYCRCFEDFSEGEFEDILSLFKSCIK